MAAYEGGVDGGALDALTPPTRDPLDKLNLAQIARHLALHPQTVRFWLDEPTFRPRRTPPRPSKLDPFKPLIRQWLEHYPYSATQIFQRLRNNGFTGGISIVREYVHKVRPHRQLDVVRRLLDDAGESGVGRRYLVPHSAGNGKSNGRVGGGIAAPRPPTEPSVRD